ncbi:cytochrome c oxidase subunit CcoM [Parendozoicomonas callyspongiae]|nr:cytochrome c oxidase subunit CcoM [Sansalvadorimonas sp. 2012CJ34-2]
MPFEALVVAGLGTVILVVGFMGGLGWFIYRDSHRKEENKDS